jgi:enoyl-CoA hydratase
MSVCVSTKTEKVSVLVESGGKQDLWVRGDWASLRLIDLDVWPREEGLVLPPCPVVGVGDAGHPEARRLDAVMEAPVSVESVQRGVARAPFAAAAAMALLRGIEGVEAERALGVESLCYGMLQGSAEHLAWRARRVARPVATPGRVRVARDGDVVRVVLDRAWARNAIDRGMRDALFGAFEMAVLDREIASVRLRSMGAAFSVGADLEEFGTTLDPAEAVAIRARTVPALMLARRPGILDVHVQGACVGAALEIAAFAGRFTASAKAWFQLPELGMGVIPGAGGCVSVPARIGRQRTALMLLSGRRIDAATALRWGLIDAIVDEPAVDEGGADEGG